MKIISILIFSILFLFGCSKQFIQVFETKSPKLNSSNNSYYYENDSLKINYTFWANQGLLSFSIYNKLETPIYIDWKNSSYISNGIKLNYWNDEVFTKSNSTEHGYYYNGPLIPSGLTIGAGTQTTASTTTKPEQVTFIPPHSSYTRTSFYLLPLSYFNFDSDKQKRIENRNDNPLKITTVYFQNYQIENSPLVFRNYLKISFSESLDKFNFVNNEFYVSSVREMDYRHFTGRTLDYQNDIYEKPFEKMSSFYIQLAKANSIEYRERFSTGKFSTGF